MTRDPVETGVRPLIRDWRTQPAAARLVAGALDRAMAACPSLRRFADALRASCAVRLVDILDHIGLPASEGPALAEAGWRSSPDMVWRHPDGLFPDVVPVSGLLVAFRVESLDTLCALARPEGATFGRPGDPLRFAELFRSPHVLVRAVERNGAVGYDAQAASPADARAAALYRQAFRARRREFDSVETGIAATAALVDAATGDLGPHWACSLFLSAERDYWMGRCVAGRLQKERQDRAGVGWANIDHHTYDASRAHLPGAVRIFERLGYVCRELFYAGADAGWGSQILEQPVLGHTIFADIDLAPDELEVDFAHHPLPPLAAHRRAGLWCAMHGESLLEGGLNHVAGQYDQRALRAQLRGLGVPLMTPFSDFPHLYQALTEGDWWPVDPARIDRLESQGHISPEEAERFRLHGAVGSHLENLERNDGFKGFNQPGIDGVLRIIDPRRMARDLPVAPAAAR